MERRTITVPMAGDSSLDAYLATPQSGSGPGLLLLPEDLGVNHYFRGLADLYAEEGYTVLAPDLHSRLRRGRESAGGIKSESGYGFADPSQAIAEIRDALVALRSQPACAGKTGALGFGIGGTLAYLAAGELALDAVVAYCGLGIERYLEKASAIKCPIVFHFGAQDNDVSAAARAAIRAAFATNDLAQLYVYSPARHFFYQHESPAFHPFSASLAYSRTIGLLRGALGPRYDLEALWEEHTRYEFETRDVEATMRTMVAEPYVNHVPTMTGGLGRRQLYQFYADHFISRLPKDTRIVPISRTVGSDRLVDEILLCFTHDTEIDFLLPGVKPTGRYVEIPTVAIVQFRGDKLYNEHIYWDQATALIQIGLLDAGNLPAAGIETVEKVLDESRPANTMIPRRDRSTDEP